MRENKELVIYKGGREILIQGVMLAFIVIASSVIGIQIFQNETKLAEMKKQRQEEIEEYKLINELQKMTDEYEEHKQEVEKIILAQETTKKVNTPTTAVTYTSRGSSVDRKVVSTIEEEAPVEYKEVLEVKATAYCLCKKCCGKSSDHPEFGITRSGLKIVPGTGMKVIAVDPKVIPLGSKVYVEGVNGVPDYGYAVAADTGGAIKNTKIDLYMDSHEDTKNWGIKSMKVYVIE